MKKGNIILFLGLLAFSSCGKKHENPEARQMLDDATAAYQAGNYTKSTELLDSLQKAYPSELTLQREAMSLRPQVIERIALLRIASVDSATAVDNANMQQLKPQLKWVKTPGMIEGYWIYAKTYNPDFMNSTGIEARVSEIGQFYIVSSANPSVKHTSVTLTANNESASTPAVPYDGESNYRIGGGEVITFSPEQSDTIGALATRIINQSKASVTLSFNGGKSKKTIKLTPTQLNGIAVAYIYSSAVIRARDNQVERQRLERTIEIARRQASNTNKADNQ